MIGNFIIKLIYTHSVDVHFNDIGKDKNDKFDNNITFCKLFDSVFVFNLKIYDFVA